MSLADSIEARAESATMAQVQQEQEQEQYEQEQKHAQEQIKLASCLLDMKEKERQYQAALAQLPSSDTVADPSLEYQLQEYGVLKLQDGFLLKKADVFNQIGIVNRQKDIPIDSEPSAEEVEELTQNIQGVEKTMQALAQKMLKRVSGTINAQIVVLEKHHQRLTAPVNATVDDLLASDGVLRQTAQVVASADAVVEANKRIIDRVQQATVACTELDRVLQAYSNAKDTLDQQQRQSYQAFNTVFKTLLVKAEQDIVSQQGVINLALNEITGLQTAADRALSAGQLAELKSLDEKWQRINTAKLVIHQQLAELERLDSSAFSTTVAELKRQAQQYFSSLTDKAEDLQAQQQLLIAKAGHNLQTQLQKDWQERVVEALDVNVEKSAFAIRSDGIKLKDNDNSLASITTSNQSTVNLTAIDNGANLSVNIPSTVKMNLEQKIAIAAKMATVAFFANKSPLEVSRMAFNQLTFNGPAHPSSKNSAFVAAVKEEVQAYIRAAQVKIPPAQTAAFDGYVTIAASAPSSIPGHQMASSSQYFRQNPPSGSVGAKASQGYNSRALSQHHYAVSSASPGDRQHFSHQPLNEFFEFSPSSASTGGSLP